MRQINFTLSAIFLLGIQGSSVFAQHPLKDRADALEIRYSASRPIIAYTLYIDSTDLSAFKVEMRVRNVPDTFRVAMVAHPEYDDRFWRYMEDLRVETKYGKANVIREDSALWRIESKGGEAILQYKIRLPRPLGTQRAAWRPFLTSTGGLIGGPHSFLYMVGATLAPSHITLKLPDGWRSASGLEPTLDPSTFFAPSVAVLTDCPILIGKFKTWPFSIDQVPHQVVYWPLPDAKQFDTIRLVNDIQKLVLQCDSLFGRLPYRDYSFLLQDGAFGALEHANSVTIGLPSVDLAKNISAYIEAVAHEYFHTWNLVRIRPVEFGDVVYKNPPLSKSLWWSEGLTMFYADLLPRRAGLPVEDTTRVNHLEALMSRYYGESGNSMISPEKVSLAAFGPPGMLGDYEASTHLQGELLGAMLDLVIRDETNGKHSIDDVMRKMMQHFSGERGFTSKDVERLVAETCNCKAGSFFEAYVYGNKAIDFNKYLQLAGLRADTTWKVASDAGGKPSADLNVYAYLSPGDTAIKIGITNPEGCWGKSGLHTGQIVLRVDGTALKSAAGFRQIIRKAQIGDTVRIEIQRPTGKMEMIVKVAGYQRPIVCIKELKGSSEGSRNLRNAWLHSL